MNENALNTLISFSLSLLFLLSRFLENKNKNNTRIFNRAFFSFAL